MIIRSIPQLTSLDQIRADAASIQGKLKNKACGGRGCAACCVLPVSVGADEIDRLAPLVDATAWSRVDRLPPGARRVPCPLLTPAGICSVYEERPLACRSTFSEFGSEPCPEGARLAPPSSAMRWAVATKVTNLLDGLRAWRRLQ